MTILRTKSAPSGQRMEIASPTKIGWPGSARSLVANVTPQRKHLLV